MATLTKHSIQKNEKFLIFYYEKLFLEQNIPFAKIFLKFLLWWTVFGNNDFKSNIIILSHIK